MLVERDPDLHAGQQPRQAGLALGQRQRPKVLAVELQQVEGLQDGSRTVPWRCKASKIATPSAPQTTASPSRVNDCALILAAALAIAGIALGPVVAAAGEQAHWLALAADDQPVAVVLDLVHPIGPGRRLGGASRDAGLDEAVGADAAGKHPGRNSRSPVAGGIVTMPRNGSSEPLNPVLV